MELVNDASHHSGWSKCLDFHRMLSALEDVPETSHPWRTMYRTIGELRDGLNHRSIQIATNPNYLKLERLARNAPGGQSYRKPSIFLDCHVNCAGNFEIFWAPRCYSELAHGITIPGGHDYLDQRFSTSREWGDRPDTEILRIKDFPMIASRADGTVWAPDEAGTVYARIMIVMIAQLFDQAHHILSQWANVEIAKRLDFLFDPTSEPLTGAMVFIEAREPLAAIELTEC